MPIGLITIKGDIMDIEDKVKLINFIKELRSTACNYDMYELRD